MNINEQFDRSNRCDGKDLPCGREERNVEGRDSEIYLLYLSYSSYIWKVEKTMEIRNVTS